MELLTIVGAVIAVIVLVALGKFLIHSLRTVFFILLFVLVVVFVFGISFTDLFDNVINAIMWVF